MFFPLQQSICLNIYNLETGITVTFSEQCFIRNIVKTGKRITSLIWKSRGSGTDEEISHILNNAKSTEVLKVKENIYFWVRNITETRKGLQSGKSGSLGIKSAHKHLTQRSR
jgi:hypothetical protein